MQRSDNRKDIICVGLPTWEGDYMKTIVQIMSLLGRNHNVLYVDYPFTWKDVAFGLLGKNNAPVNRMLGKEPRLRRIETAEDSTVHVLTLPPTIPANWIGSELLYKKLMAVQSGTVAAAINKAAYQLNMQHPIIINAFNPFFGLPLLGKLNESMVLYYCYDEIRAAHWCSRHGGVIEEEFLKKIQGVITTSESLYQEKRHIQPAAFLVKNGVNYRLFSKGFKPNPPPGAAPVIGYLGSVDDRLDVELLLQVAKAFPHATLEIVGRVVSKEVGKKLSEQTNVILQGAHQPEKLPKFLSNWNVGLIPFKRNEFTKNIYPLKINEYLAAGLPVVMTPFASLEEFEGMVSVEGVASDFIKSVAGAIKHDSAEERQERKNFANQNSWETRVKQLESIVLAVYEDNVEMPSTI